MNNKKLAASSIYVIGFRDAAYAAYPGLSPDWQSLSATAAHLRKCAKKLDKVDPKLADYAASFAAEVDALQGRLITDDHARLFDNEVMA